MSFRDLEFERSQEIFPTQVHAVIAYVLDIYKSRCSDPLLWRKSPALSGHSKLKWRAPVNALNNARFVHAGRVMHNSAHIHVHIQGGGGGGGGGGCIVSGAHIASF